MPVEGNEIYDCGTGGFTAGQGTGFEYMTSPWLHYEAYAVRVVNNLIHDTEGAGLGVNGGYNILLAYNTLYRVGARSHLLEFVFGLRTCDGDTDGCGRNLAAGGWGTTVTGAEEPIPNRNVYVFNNLLVNPRGYASRWQHLAVYGPRMPTGDSHIPSPAAADEGLAIKGNVIWNGPADHPLGVGDESGCAGDNPTCNMTQLLADNAFNSIYPQFADVAGGGWDMVNADDLPQPVAIPAFPAWGAFTPPVPAGAISPVVPVDMRGQLRRGHDTVGAVVTSEVPTTPAARVFVPCLWK